MKELGVVARATTSPLDSLEGGSNGLAVIEATPENLEALAANLPKVRHYTKNGGWVVLNGLTPDGLASYNKLVGYQHIIRPFRQEKVLFSYPRNPLTAGMSGGDLAMYSSKRIFSWTAGNYVANDEFQYVVDTNDAAPFATFNNQFYDNIVNGFVSSDGWPLIVDVPVPKSGPVEVDMKLPAARTIDAITWIGNTMYWPTTHITLKFEGKNPTSLGLNVPPDDLPHRYTFNPVTFTHMQLLVDGWNVVPGVNGLVGIDNINLWVAPSPAYTKRVRPMVADGGMIEYPQGKGGIVLCNLWFKPNEDVPLNAIKKRRLFGALLQNLHAHYGSAAGGSTIPAMEYTPISLADAANAFTGPQGWFGDKVHSFEALPSGTQWMNGVEYSIYAFKTSPVPTCIIIGAQTAKGIVAASPSIAIHRKAEALYFLQSANIRALTQKGETLGQYIITYEDGQTVKVPLLAHINIDSYMQAQLQTLPGADTAWSHKWPDGKMAEAFTFKWINPRPTETIETARLVAANNMPAGIALLALTAASARTAKQN
jgi:beta-galactosidase